MILQSLFFNFSLKYSSVKFYNEGASSHPISYVKQHWANIVLEFVGLLGISVAAGVDLYLGAF